MLNPFPYLLTFQFFAPTLLRIAVGLFFIITGYKRITIKKAESAEALTARYKTFANPLVWYLALVELAVGASLFVGFLTQIGALLGAVVALKMIWFSKRYPGLNWHNRATYVLVLIICLSLLLTGAGALAFDLPL